MTVGKHVELLVNRRPGQETSPTSEAGAERVSPFNPLPVTLEGLTLGAQGMPGVFGVQAYADLLWRLSLEGRVFMASSATAQDTTITGQIAFAATTPTFMIRVASGSVVVPIFMNLDLGGTVAGGAVSIVVEADVVERYSTGGTSEKILSTRGLRRRAQSTVYSNPTALAGYGISMYRAVWDQAIASASVPASWRPEAPYFLEGPAALLVYTWAATTGPTWLWSMGFAEWPSSALAATEGIVS